MDAQEEKRNRAEAAFERVWTNFRLDKARLRNLNERDKAELKTIMKTVFMSCIPTSAPETQEIKFEIGGGGAEGPEVESAVRRVLQEELGGLQALLKDIRDKPAETRVIHETAGRTGKSESAEVVELHSAMFEADMNTNIDDVSVDGGEVQGVGGNLAALRKLMKGEEKEDTP